MAPQGSEREISLAWQPPELFSRRDPLRSASARRSEVAPNLLGYRALISAQLGQPTKKIKMFSRVMVDVRHTADDMRNKESA